MGPIMSTWTDPLFGRATMPPKEELRFYRLIENATEERSLSPASTSLDSRSRRPPLWGQGAIETHNEQPATEPTLTRTPGRDPPLRDRAARRDEAPLRSPVTRPSLHGP